MDKYKVIPKAPPLECVAGDWFLRILLALGDQILQFLVREDLKVVVVQEGPENLGSRPAVEKGVFRQWPA